MKYYSLEKDRGTAILNILGDISSAGWDGDVTARGLVKELEALGDVSQINVYINSYGGEVAEGLAIYNALKRHSAKVKTVCDGFACSIASVIFMAGDERVMNESSLLMIHNAWTLAMGNAEELRKQADDLEKITQASVEAYKAHSNLSEEKIKELMDNETWILPSEALEYGFATSIEKTESKKESQSVMKTLINIVKEHQKTGEKPTNEGEQKPEGEQPDGKETGAEIGANDGVNTDNGTQAEQDTSIPEQKLGIEIFFENLMKKE